MTDKDNSPHIAAFQELEAALDAHRRTQAEAGAVARADAPKREPRRAWFARRWGLRNPGWRLPFNPWFMFDRRHPVVRKATIGRRRHCRGGADFRRMRFGGGSGAGRSCSISSRPGSRRRSSRTSAAATASKSAALNSSATLGPYGVAPTRHRAARLVRRDRCGGAQGGSRNFRDESPDRHPPRKLRLVDANVVRIDADGRINVMVGGERPFVTIAPEREAQSNPAQSTASVASQTAPSNSTPARQTPPIKPPQQELTGFLPADDVRTQRWDQCHRLARVDRRAGQGPQ